MPPDNRMKPKQSGINVWLQTAIIQRVGNDKAQHIITLAAYHGTKRYQYMLDQMASMGHVDIVEEYHQKKKGDILQRAIRDKKKHLARYQRQLETCNDPKRSVRLRGQIQKIEDYLRKAEEELTNGRETPKAQATQ
jgi:hypothetical protein